MKPHKKRKQRKAERGKYINNERKTERPN